MSFNGQTVKGDNVKLYQAGGGKHFNHTFTTWWCVCFIKSKSNSSSRTKKNETKKIIIINWKFLNCIIWRVYTIINWLRYIGDLLNFFFCCFITPKKRSFWLQFIVHLSSWNPIFHWTISKWLPSTMAYDGVSIKF